MWRKVALGCFLVASSCVDLCWFTLVLLSCVRWFQLHWYCSTNLVSESVILSVTLWQRTYTGANTKTLKCFCAMHESVVHCADMQILGQFYADAMQIGVHFLKLSSSSVQRYHDNISIMITSNFSDPCIALFYQFVPQFFGISRKVQEDGTKVVMLMNAILLNFSYLFSQLYSTTKVILLLNLKLKQFRHPEHQFLGCLEKLSFNMIGVSSYKWLLYNM